MKKEEGAHRGGAGSTETWRGCGGGLRRLGRLGTETRSCTAWSTRTRDPSGVRATSEWDSSNTPEARWRTTDCVEVFCDQQGQAAASLDIDADHCVHGTGTVPAAMGSSLTTEESSRAAVHGKG
jgi:hypothetical protein